jgi:hypothetical protein
MTKIAIAPAELPNVRTGDDCDTRESDNNQRDSSIRRHGAPNSGLSARGNGRGSQHRSIFELDHRLTTSRFVLLLVDLGQKARTLPVFTS